MEFSHDDAGLAGQPVGYWSWAAHKSVIGHPRRAGRSRPDPAPSGGCSVRCWRAGRRDAAVRSWSASWAATWTSGPPCTTRSRGSVVQDADGRLYVTPEGEKLRAEALVTQQASRATIHDGIPDEAYVRALNVLQRMIHNTGGKAWHH